jgi:GNAT superfamily N-acetyltransferase
LLVAGGTDGLSTGEGLAAILGDNRCRLAVGVIDGAVVGAGLARLGRFECERLLFRPPRSGDDDAYAADPPLAGEPSLATIDLLYVIPEARAVGVGEAVLDDLVGWCRERGCAGVDVPALPGARETKNFLEAAGFSARLLVMHRKLPL